MKIGLIHLLRCPASGQKLLWRSEDSTLNTTELITGWLVSEDGQHEYPVNFGIPRFVPENNYAASFGLQWNFFSKTQLDSHTGQSISAKRFWKATGWHCSDMKDKWVLDVGCGSGRFAEVALASGARVVALDYSGAVDACYENLKHHENFHVVQGDIYELPFAPASFSFVYSLGVLQHTPDVERSFAALPKVLQCGGFICVDYYEKSIKSYFLPKYWLRPLTKQIPKKKLFLFLKKIIPTLLFASDLVRHIPVVGKYLSRLIPVANYRGELPLTHKQIQEWALLDTFDWLSPAYDNPQTKESAYNYARQADLECIEIFKCGHLVVRARKAA